MRYFFTFLLLCACYTLQAQDYFNTEAFWNKLVPEAASTASIKSDTVIIVASNRKENKGDLRFMTEERDEKHVRYFVVYAKNGKWHIQPRQTLLSAVTSIPDKNKDWVIYTEGMGKIFTSDVDRAMNLSSQYKVNVLLLDYPSISTTRKRLGNYKFAIKNARVAYKDFLPVFDTLKMLREKKELGTGSFNLFFHSMGNNVLRGVAKSGQFDDLNNKVWVDNLILNAPCVPQKKHKKWLCNIAFAKQTYVHYNPEDRTLKGAHLVSFKKQLGEKVKGPVCNDAMYINFNTLTQEGHSNFLSLRNRPAATPAAIKHYNNLFHGKEPTLTDTSVYRPTAYRSIGYDILP